MKPGPMCISVPIAIARSVHGRHQAEQDHQTAGAEIATMPDYVGNSRMLAASALNGQGLLLPAGLAGLVFLF